ncbi:hypothetical protein IJS77_00545 [bacterium]|nr:hypothetical protein [bacterium]
MNKNASNPFLTYLQPQETVFKMPVAKMYNDSLKAFAKTNEKPKQKVFNNMSKLLQESFFVGATKFGNNFIG